MTVLNAFCPSLVEAILECTFFSFFNTLEITTLVFDEKREKSSLVDRYAKE